MIKVNMAEYTVYGKKEMKWCEIRGYSVDIGDVISVPVELIDKGSRARIVAECDVCGREVKIAYSSYNQNISNQGFYCCPKCKYTKQKNTNMKRYGTECSLLNADVHNKAVQTSMKRYGTTCPAASKECQQKLIESNIEKYGVPYPVVLKEVQDKIKATNLAKYGNEYSIASESVRDKIKQTCLERYGSENPMGNREIYDKALSTKLKTMGDSYTYVSRQQQHIYDVYGGELNFHIGGYFVDILIDNRIFFEYDGGGHDLAVKAGWCSQVDFENKENRRTEYLLSVGYKEFRMKSSTDSIPSDDKLIALLEFANLMFDSGKVSFIYNIDNNTFNIK